MSGTRNGNIEESEKPAKVWQIHDLSSKIDGILQTQDEIKQLIRDQSNTYPTKTELALELEKRDNKIADLQKTIKNYSRVVWTVAGAVVPIVAATVWQLLVNSARGGS